MDRPINVLVVEDEPAAVESLSRVLSRLDGRVAMEQARTLDEAVTWLSANGASVVLLDLTLPDATGTRALSEITRRFPNLPVVIYTGGGPELEADCLKAGAEDFLRKAVTPPEQLVLALRHAVIRHEVYCEMSTRYQPVLSKLQSARQASAEVRESVGKAGEHMHDTATAAGESVRTEEQVSDDDREAIQEAIALIPEKTAAKVVEKLKEREKP